MTLHPAKKSLGQNFLIAGGIIHRIVKALNLKPQDKVLEIGPGRGALTEVIATQVAKLLLIEKDSWLSEALATKFSKLSNVVIFTNDFLEINWSEIEATLGEHFKIVSNLPYNVATAILEKLLLHAKPKTEMVLMFQKEVADRLRGTPRSKAYGSLSIFAQILAEIRPVCEVPPKAFRPMPKITSSVLHFVLRENPLIDRAHLQAFETFVQSGFAQRRKMLRQNLKQYANSSSEIESKLENIGASPQARAEELSVEQWVALFQSLSTSR